MVKPMNGLPMYRLALLFLAIGAMIEVLASSAQSGSIPQWSARLAKWLGKQLTIGGKGVAGEGEGRVEKRIQLFFSTPYLHDYD